jgi:hypothetical protein
MSCSKCGKRKIIKEEDYDVMGGYKYLPHNQIKARLELFKKRFCKSCDLRYECDYVRYKKCKNK